MGGKRRIEPVITPSLLAFEITAEQLNQAYLRGPS